MSCGECSKCCRILAISELDKPANKACPHVRAGACACSIYKDRPESCAGYKCGWLASQSKSEPMPPDLRPDRSHMIIDPINGNLVIRVDAHRDITPEEDPRVIPYINAYLEKGREVLITKGNSRRLLALK